MKKLRKSILSSGLVILGLTVGLVTPVVEATPAGTTRVSVDSSGNQANSHNFVYDVSEDGKYILFMSVATNLVSGDTNGKQDFFVKDTDTGAIDRVTVSSSGTQGNGHANDAKMSADGKFVVFSSDATNLVAGDTNGQKDIFLRDRSAGTTEIISKSTSGTLSNGSNQKPDVSDDGRFVVFESTGSNLIASDTNSVYDIFVRDRTSNTTKRVSESASGTQGNGWSNWPLISCDGRFIAFHTKATNLTVSDANGSAEDVVLVDRLGDLVTGITTSGNNASYLHDLTCNADYLVFESYASDLIAGDTNSSSDTFRYERSTGTITRVSLADDESEGNSGSGGASISSDGRYIAFMSSATNLIAGDTNGFTDVFVRDMVNETTERMNVSTGGTAGNGYIFNIFLSRDAHYVIYDSEATNLVASDTNSAADVFKTDTGYTPLICY